MKVYNRYNTEKDKGGAKDLGMSEEELIVASILAGKLQRPARELKSVASSSTSSC